MISPPVTGSGGPPNGPAGGDLDGSYPNPGVAKVDGVAISNSPAGANLILVTTSTAAAHWTAIPASAVTSVFGRTGAVVSASGDYTDAQVTGSPTNVLTTTGDILYASAANTLARLGAGTQFFTLQQGATIPAWAASATSTLTTAGDLLTASAAHTLARVAVGTAGQVLGVAAGLPAWVLPPGFEIGYAQIVAPVSITDTAEASATALISSGSLTFDGGPVMVEVYTPALNTPSVSAGNLVILTLFEGSTEIGRLLELVTPAIGSMFVGVTARYRFTPSAGAHSYKLCGFVTSTTGTPQLSAGTPGVGAFVPAYLRFTKV